MVDEERSRLKLKRDIRDAKNLRDQFMKETEELNFYIEQKEKKLDEL